MNKWQSDLHSCHEACPHPTTPYLLAGPSMQKGDQRDPQEQPKEINCNLRRIFYLCKENLDFYPVFPGTTLQPKATIQPNIVIYVQVKESHMRLELSLKFPLQLFSMLTKPLSELNRETCFFRNCR